MTASGSKYVSFKMSLFDILSKSKMIKRFYINQSDKLDDVISNQSKGWIGHDLATILK